MRRPWAVIGSGAVVLVVLAAAVWLLRDDDEPDPTDPAPTATATSVPALPTSTPTQDIALVPACPVETVTWRHEVREAGASREILLFASSPSACRLTTAVQVTIMAANGEPANAIINPIALAVNAILPTERPVAAALWSNWCEEANPGLKVAFATISVEDSHTSQPDCRDRALASQLSALAATGALPSPTATPLPAALTPVVPPPTTITVAVYADSSPASTSCIEIVEAIVPVGAAGKVPSKPYACGGDFSRISFAADAARLHYVLGVELLLMAKASLPQPSSGDGTCGSIREHLLAASEDPQTAAYVLVCQVQPLPRGASPTSAHGVIWARMPDGVELNPLPPPETPCWALSRYLGPPRERSSYPVQCSLE